MMTCSLAYVFVRVVTLPLTDVDKRTHGLHSADEVEI